MTFRIETEAEVNVYISKIQYAINNGASISFQEKRKVDDDRDERYSNRYAVRSLFPDENPIDVLKRELSTLTAENYLRTVKDTRYFKRSEMREFGKTYHGTEEIYIKIRVEILDPKGGWGHTIFVMSFHYSTIPFSQEIFPYKK